MRKTFIKTLIQIARGAASGSTFLAAALLLAGCASSPKLKGGERLAIVSYTLQKSITRSGGPYDLGPVLPSQQEHYYQYHQKSIDLAWAEFKVKAPAIFASRNLVDFSAVEGSAELKAATAPEPRKTLGIDLSAAGQRVHPGELNYADLGDPKRSAAIAAILNADILVAFDLRAEYYTAGGMSIGALNAARSHMRLTALVTLADASGKVIMRKSVSGISKETAITGTLDGLELDMDRADYPRLILSAQEDLFRNLAKEVASW